jgi:hypothetical protein
VALGGLIFSFSTLSVQRFVFFLSPGVPTKQNEKVKCMKWNLASNRLAKGEKITHEEFAPGEYLENVKNNIIRTKPNGTTTEARIKGNLLLDDKWSVYKVNIEKKATSKPKKKAVKKRATSKKAAA